MMTLGLLAYLIKLFGPTLARMLLATLLKDRVDFAAMTKSPMVTVKQSAMPIISLTKLVTKPQRSWPRSFNGKTARSTKLNGAILSMPPKRH